MVNGVEVWKQSLFSGVWTGSSFSTHSTGIETSGSLWRASVINPLGGNTGAWLSTLANDDEPFIKNQVSEAKYSTTLTIKILVTSTNSFNINNSTKRVDWHGIGSGYGDYGFRIFLATSITSNNITISVSSVGMLRFSIGSDYGAWITLI